MTNCKNCGAVLTGAKCEYCGTVYEEERPAETVNFYADGKLIYTSIVERQKVAQQLYDSGLVSSNDIRNFF